MYVVTSDGGSCVTDAVQQSRHILRAAAAFRGEQFHLSNKRYSFQFSGSTQGFVPCPYADEPQSGMTLSNLNESSEESGLVIAYEALAAGTSACVSTPVFLDFSVLADNFATIASPTLYSSQTIVARIKAFDKDNPALRFYILYYGLDNSVKKMTGDVFQISDEISELRWKVPDTGGMPIFRVGIELLSGKRLDGRIAVLDMDWLGAPEQYAQSGMLMESIWNLNPYWLQAWVSSAKQFAPDFEYTYCISHTDHEGVVTIGTQDWANYSVTSKIAFSIHQAGGLVLRGHGHRQYYAAILSGGDTASIFIRRNDIVEQLASTEFHYEMDRQYEMSFEAIDNEFSLSIDGARILKTKDPKRTYVNGGAGFLVDSGTMLADGFAVARL